MKKTIVFLVILAIIGLTINLIRFWPDGKLHIAFCDVGQGDGAYIRFSSGQDMMIDGGPDSKILNCLSKEMPFYDRTIDIVLLTHPQADHLNGLINVLDRYNVGTFVIPPVGNATEGYVSLIKRIQDKHIPVKNLYSGSTLRFGEAKIAILWPERLWVENHVGNDPCLIDRSGSTHGSTPTVCVVNPKLNNPEHVVASIIERKGQVLGASTVTDLNQFSIFARISYGSFDALFTGDGDAGTQKEAINDNISFHPDKENPIEVLKVPHHGSRTGMLDQFLDDVSPKIAVISVGKKNRYGHPAPQTLTRLAERGIKTYRTDIVGTVEVVSDGRVWSVNAGKIN